MRRRNQLAAARWPRWQSGWLLTDSERDNPATAIGPSTEGNQVRLLLHGSDYFPRLAAELRDTKAGDLVLICGWRVDAEQRLGTVTVADGVLAAVRSGALVRGLIWRSHPSWLVGSWGKNRQFAMRINRAGGQILLDHRVAPLGSHHQKFVVIRRSGNPAGDVAFVGGLDLARSRFDGPQHSGDPRSRDFADAYGPTPAWHDLQLEIRGPAVAQVEEVFRQRWEHSAPMTYLPQHRIPDLVSGLPQRSTPMPVRQPAPPPTGHQRVQLLQTYPSRRMYRYPFAPRGEFSVARGLVKAITRARRLIYLEDQYLWSAEVGRVLDEALRSQPDLHVVTVCPRYPDVEGKLKLPLVAAGQHSAMRMVSEAVKDRILLLDIENGAGWPIYVHAKIAIVDDTWAAVGSANLNRRSWSHDSELTVAVLDDPLAGGVQSLALRLRLKLLRDTCSAPMVQTMTWSTPTRPCRCCAKVPPGWTTGTALGSRVRVQPDEYGHARWSSHQPGRSRW
ncbi:MAG: phospholipase D family protein [Brooklawnia sp.]|uniref:phospholipase D-like domain-containing protein n=1 Tax=Brooklawnia sp. TaxID=2699740 RepID=UPI003C720B69